MLSLPTSVGFRSVPKFFDHVPAWDWLRWCSCRQRSHCLLMGPQWVQGGEGRRVLHLYSAKRWALPSHGSCSPCPSLLSQTDADRSGHGCAIRTPRGQEVGRHNIGGGPCRLLLAGQPARMVESAGFLYPAELFPQQ